MEKIKVVDLNNWFDKKDEIKPEENTEYITLYANGKAIGRHYVINKEE